MFKIRENEEQHRIHNQAKVIIFGSRAMGTHRRGSDVDLALKNNDSQDLSSQISMELNEESILPYKFDVVDYHSIQNKELLAHIDQLGKPLWLRGSKR